MYDIFVRFKTEHSNLSIIYQDIIQQSDAACNGKKSQNEKNPPNGELVSGNINITQRG